MGFLFVDKVQLIQKNDKIKLQIKLIKMKEVPEDIEVMSEEM